MENNFYVGDVCHKRLFGTVTTEKNVLYSDDNINYLELNTGIWYSTDSNEKDYVDESSIISTDISLFKEDYMLLLDKYRDKTIKKKNRFLNI